MEPSLFERIARAPDLDVTAFIPLHDVAVFDALASTCFQELARSDAGTPARVFADPASLGMLTGLKSALPPAVELTPLVREASATAGLNPPADHAPSGRVFICLAPFMTVTLLCSGAGTNGAAGFTGGWSFRRADARAVLACLVAHGAAAAGAPGAVDELPAPPEAEPDARAMALMAAHARAQADQHASVARDKADLFSVLAILKAISARRRAHDILFVFVEQISRVVASDRCSIVRIWGGDPHGNVVASHEDASVVDKSIELFKYPELSHAMMARQKIVINDALDPGNEGPFATELRQARINSLVVIPIVLFDQHVGTLLLRAARLDGNFTPREVSFFEIVAEAASNALERAQLFESIQIANERLERLAITDGLTGLYNHRHFREQLEQEFDRASRYKLPLSCMIFDVDDFKSLNDTYGHLTGDQVLQEIAARTQRSVRKHDLVARYGGEEFVLIMPQTGREGAAVEAERIREVIDATPFLGVSGEHRVTVSGGVSVLDHESMLNSADLLREADQALYEAKRNGKNQVVLAPARGTL